MNAEGNKFENPFGFEEKPKKIKLEDQSQEIQRLNQIITDLKGTLLVNVLHYRLKFNNIWSAC